MTETLLTRLSNSIGISQPTCHSPCLLVRISPVNGLEKPIELTDEVFTIGRDEHAALLMLDDSVSRRHARIDCENGQHILSDLGSTNGTYVNETRLSSSIALRAGDRVRFGNQIFKYLSSNNIETQYHEVVYKMMTTDGLTSVHNKRYFLDTLDREIHQTRRGGSPLCVMMMDLDKFKSVNDTHGHLAGDAVLVEFAKRARSVLRSGDLLARFGGEEFVVLMTRTPLEDAITVAERIREVTSAEPVIFENTLIPITVSIGVESLSTNALISEASAATELLAEADHLLYVAKESGRNQVQFKKGTKLS